MGSTLANTEQRSVAVISKGLQNSVPISTQTRFRSRNAIAGKTEIQERKDYWFADLTHEMACEQGKYPLGLFWCAGMKEILHATCPGVDLFLDCGFRSGAGH